MAGPARSRLSRTITLLSLSHFRAPRPAWANPARHLYHGRAAFRSDGLIEIGPITPCKGADQATIHRNHSVLEGVVSGIASYGNCFGVPNLGGETKFEPCYSGNPLVNAFALGLVRRDQIFYASSGRGNR